ncbi:hypothetical protein [Nocardia caishijiensis]|uniref:SnoaL-like domain-containing protein n=1 Tax=Nocardia caishijiensis TaxID=184756 RepID=A0ABQ6YL45_9NOCA|nr:hypothetical protein [Nocardia caishijiensis]KAF0846221.1 hypothetical protein FNL39_105132 [Nocardia caishijiensis]
MTSHEVARIFRRPTAGGVLLSMFYVEVESFDDVIGFGRRLREVVNVGVDASLTADFEGDFIPETGVLQWMREAWGSAAVRYGAHRGHEEWTVQDVLFSFDPREREWAWWDVTKVFGNIVRVWVDSFGEGVYKCEELRWIIYLCGAKSVVGPLPQVSEDWEKSVSVAV